VQLVHGAKRHLTGVGHDHGNDLLEPGIGGAVQADQGHNSWLCHFRCRLCNLAARRGWRRNVNRLCLGFFLDIGLDLIGGLALGLCQEHLSLLQLLGQLCHLLLKGNLISILGSLLKLCQLLLRSLVALGGQLGLLGVSQKLSNSLLGCHSFSEVWNRKALEIGC
jgi:hypothetical protein